MSMRIATWNLDCVRPSLGARSARIREALGHIDADVWVLTESHPEFAPAGEYRRIAMSAQAPDRVHGGCWVAIWVRDGIPAEALVLTGEPERSAGVRIARPGDRSILVFGTVLPWRGDTRHGAYRGGRAFERALVAQASDWMNPVTGTDQVVGKLERFVGGAPSSFTVSKDGATVLYGRVAGDGADLMLIENFR